jgi:hypothetical protein
MFSLINHDNVNEYKFNELNDGDVLYIKTDAIYNFYRILNNINKKFILVTGCSDYTIPNDIFSNNKEFIDFINNNKIIKWYAENCVYEHSKIVKLPIGLDYHTMNNSDHAWGSQKTPIKQETELIIIKSISKPFYDRVYKIYSNCHFFTTTKYGNDRIQALNNISRDLLYLEPNKVNRKTTWSNQINYSFVLSPHGNGLDCHRTWEALVLGSIPIVKTSCIDGLYTDLPVLIVNQWSDVNEQLLLNTIENFKNKKFNYEKLTLKYWINLMKN